MLELVNRPIMFNYVPELIEKSFVRDVMESYYQLCYHYKEVVDIWTLTHEISQPYSFYIPSFYESDGTDLHYFEKLYSELPDDDKSSLATELREISFGELEDDICRLLIHFNFSYQIDSFYGFENGISPVTEVW